MEENRFVIPNSRVAQKGKVSFNFAILGEEEWEGHGRNLH